MKRLLALILTLFLAFPAIAMPVSHDMVGQESLTGITDCHGKPMTSAGHDEGKKGGAVMKSDCIGCAAPSGLARVAAPQPVMKRPPYVVSLAAFAVAAMSAPEPPPPRT